LPFRDSETHLRDILQSIGYVDGFLGGMTLDEYKDDLKTKSAVERQCRSLQRQPTD
jgi:uncharacterized protein with HEPN domain